MPATAPGKYAVNVNYLNSRLGTGASLAALAALDESDETYVETIEIKKQKACTLINAEAQQVIYAGFPYEINGQEYHIGYSFFDQQNLASRALVAAQNPGMTISLPCIDENGQNVWLDVPTETVTAIHKYGLVSHTDAILKACNEKKTRIMAAETEEEIKAIYME